MDISSILTIEEFLWYNLVQTIEEDLASENEPVSEFWSSGVTKYSFPITCVFKCLTLKLCVL